MTDTTPATRAEARETAEAAATEVTAERVTTDTGFLPLAVRRGLYLLGIAGLVAGPIIGVQLPEYGDAIFTGGNLLSAMGLGTALTNVGR